MIAAMSFSGPSVDVRCRANRRCRPRYRGPSAGTPWGAAKQAGTRIPCRPPRRTPPNAPVHPPGAAATAWCARNKNAAPVVVQRRVRRRLLRLLQELQQDAGIRPGARCDRRQFDLELRIVIGGWHLALLHGFEDVGRATPDPNE